MRALRSAHAIEPWRRPRGSAARSADAACRRRGSRSSSGAAPGGARAPCRRRARVTLPEVGMTRPMIMAMVVVLPAPLPPSSAGDRARLRARTRCRRPRAWSCRASRAGRRRWRARLRASALSWAFCSAKAKMWQGRAGEARGASRPTQVGFIATCASRNALTGETRVRVGNRPR